MSLFIPVRTIFKVSPIFILMGLLFPAGMFIGLATNCLFTTPSLLTPFFWLAIPVALVTGWIMYGLGKESLKKPADRGGFFSMNGLTPIIVLCMTSTSLIGGLWLGGIAGRDGRDSALAAARLKKLAAERKISTAPHLSKPVPTIPKLQAIFYSSTNSTAILNGKTVAVGKTVAGWSVTEIEPRSVTIQSTAGESKTLSLQ